MGSGALSHPGDKFHDKMNYALASLLYSLLVHSLPVCYHAAPPPGLPPHVCSSRLQVPVRLHPSPLQRPAQ